MQLTTEHVFSNCPCTGITRIVLVSHPVDAEIHVRACVEYMQTPLLSAMHELAQAIGRSIILEDDAVSLIARFSRLCPNAVLGDVRCVLRGPGRRRYYVRREVLHACRESQIRKCMACGERNCLDEGHRDASEFEQLIRRTGDGYVYFMLHTPTKYLKVGYSSQPAKRLQTHRFSIPGDVTTLGVVPGGKMLERAIHDELSHWLVPGYHEWFFYAEAVRDYIDRIVSVYANTASANRIGKDTVYAGD